MVEQKVSIVCLILQILTSTMKISQKRKVYRPHFTLSFEGLFQIYEVVNVFSNGNYSPSAELGLQAVLMSTPPVTILCMVYFLPLSLSLSLGANTCMCASMLDMLCVCLCALSLQI